MALELSERVRTFGVGSPRIADLPDLAEIQKSSFKWFIDEGLGEELRAFSPIKDYTGRLELHFLPNYTFEDHTEPNKPKTPEDARSMDASFTKKLRIQMRLVNREIGEIKEQEIYVGDIPMMTDRGTFIINGAERVIVSQIVRSPGIYYKREVDTNGKRTFSATLIPNRGAWLKFETDVNDVIYVKIDKNRKLPATTLLRALGYSDQEMEALFRHRDFLKKTLDKDSTKSREDSLIEVYRKLRPGDPPSVAGGQSIIDSRFFDDKRYDLGKVGRYKLNKKLSLSVSEAQRTLTREDIVAAVDYLIGLHYDEGHVDDIDHLGNRRIRSVGELLQNQFRIGLTRLERIVRERMTLQDADTLTPANLLNTKPLVAAIREFFGSSQLSQFMDQTNPLAELTHKRRLSALGPGGLSRERAGFAVRDMNKNFSAQFILVAATICGAMSMTQLATAKGVTWTVEMRQNKLMQDINLAQKQNQLTVKEAKKLRDQLSDVAAKKKKYRNEHKATGEKLSADETKELEEDLNSISEDIKKKQLEKRTEAK